MASLQAAPASTLLPHPAFASLGRRLAAHVLDVLIAFSVVLLASFILRVLRATGLWTPVVIQGITPEELWKSLGAPAKLSVVLATLSTGPVYRVLFEASAWQATFGKRWLNIYVTSDDGMRISLTRSFYRWLARWVFGCLGGSFVSLGTILGTSNHKALHDYFGKTVVVRGRPLPGGMLEPWRIAAAFGVPFVWMMGTFLSTL